MFIRLDLVILGVFSNLYDSYRGDAIQFYSLSCTDDMESPECNFSKAVAQHTPINVSRLRLKCSNT